MSFYISWPRCSDGLGGPCKAFDTGFKCYHHLLRIEPCEAHKRFLEKETGLKAHGLVQYTSPSSTSFAATLLEIMEGWGIKIARERFQGYCHQYHLNWRASGKCDGVQIWHGDSIALESFDPTLEEYGASDVMLLGEQRQILARCYVERDVDGKLHLRPWLSDEDYIVDGQKQARIAGLAAMRQAMKVREERMGVEERLIRYEIEREEKWKRAELEHKLARAEAEAEHQRRANERLERRGKDKLEHEERRKRMEFEYELARAEAEHQRRMEEEIYAEGSDECYERHPQQPENPYSPHRRNSTSRDTSPRSVHFDQDPRVRRPYDGEGWATKQREEQIEEERKDTFRRANAEAATRILKNLSYRIVGGTGSRL